MNIAGYDIQPIMPYLDCEPKWQLRTDRGLTHFINAGLDVPMLVRGIHAEKVGVNGVRPYLEDHPEDNWILPQRTVGSYLTHMMLNAVMQSHPEHKYWMILEDDARFVEDWRERLEKALKTLPADWDFLFVGSCCACDKQGVAIGNDVYEFPYRGEAMWQYYPMCGHAYILNAKCLPLLIETQQHADYPMDISLIKFAFPKMKVYGILPRLAEQENTHLPN